MIHPLADYLYIRLVAVADRTDSGILLPGEQRAAWDGIVESVGPGVMDSRGRFGDLQAVHGDRVVCQQAHFMALDAETGFVRDRHLVARLLGPEHDALLPCGDYVALAPDPLPAVAKTGGDVLVAAGTMRGGESRYRQRGEELYREFVGMGRRWERMGLARYEWRERFQHEYNALAPVDRDALAFAYQKRGQTNFMSYTAPSTAKRPGSGCILGFGPRVVEPVRSLGIGTRVWWDSDASLIDCWDGSRTVVMCRWDELAAAEVA